MANEDFKDLLWKKGSGKVLHDKALDIAKNSKYDGYHVDLLEWFTSFSIKCLIHVQINMLLILEIIKVKSNQTNNYHRNYTNQLIEFIL